MRCGLAIAATVAGAFWLYGLFSQDSLRNAVNYAIASVVIIGIAMIVTRWR